mgnify:CR=1 FL=1
MVRYMGIFFEGEQAELIKSLQPTKLEWTNDEIHCTFKYKHTEDELFDEIVGQDVEVYLVGYGWDGDNSGFEVAFDESYVTYYINYHEDKKDENGFPLLKPKHITASLSKGAVAAHTKDLDFVKLAKPIMVTGRFGYWIADKKTPGYISYEPYLNKKISK